MGLFAREKSQVGIYQNFLLLEGYNGTRLVINTNDIKHVSCGIAIKNINLKTLLLLFPHFEIFRKGVVCHLIDGSRIFIASSSPEQFSKEISQRIRKGISMPERPNAHEAQTSSKEEHELSVA